MSRIGRKVLPLPKGVTLAQKAGMVSVKGPKGELSKAIPRPERTFGMLPWPTYMRCPGRERRRMPVMALVRGSAQRRRTTISGKPVAPSRTSQPEM